MTERHDRRDELTPAAMTDQAREWAMTLEKRTGRKVPEAREIIAHRLGVAPGTLERLRKRRLKNPGAWLYWKLRAAIINELQAEAIRLAHEAQLIAAAGVDPRSDEAISVATSRAKVLQSLGEE